MTRGVALSGPQRRPLPLHQPLHPLLARNRPRWPIHQCT
jgi:hypothetical protein